MTNGYLCIGGPADGQYHTIDDPQHGIKIAVLPRIEYEGPFASLVGTETKMVMVIYKVWVWHQGEDGRKRFYLIPEDWDGLEAMDHLEKLAYGRDR